MKSKKILLIILSAVLLVAATIVGTLAYLTDRETVTNTFTVGDVQITLDEAKVTPDGEKIIPEERVVSNSYHLIPGKSYIKDPTMTVEKGSEEAYVRMRVTINKLAQLDAIFSPNGADLTQIFIGYDAANWDLFATTRDMTANTVTYEFRCPATVDAKNDAVVLDPLFDKIQLPGFVTGDQLSTLYVNEQDRLTITVVGDAIQAETFADADEAWTAFVAQNGNH